MTMLEAEVGWEAINTSLKASWDELLICDIWNVALDHQHEVSPVRTWPLIMWEQGIHKIGSFFISGLFLLYNVHVADGGISISAAAAGGAMYALGGAGVGGENYRDEQAEALIMLLVAAAAGGIVLVMIGYVGWRLFRRYVLKIQEPDKNFVVDKKVKCRAGKYRYDGEELVEETEEESPPPKYETV